MTSPQAAQFFWISVFRNPCCVCFRFLQCCVCFRFCFFLHCATRLCTSSILGASPLTLDLFFSTWLPDHPPNQDCPGLPMVQTIRQLLESDPYGWPNSLAQFMAATVLWIILYFGAQYHFPMAWTEAWNNVDTFSLRLGDCMVTSLHLVHLAFWVPYLLLPGPMNHQH